MENQITQQALEIDNPQVFTETEAAAYIKLSPHTLRQSRCHGSVSGRIPTPPYLKLGRSVRYRKQDLDDWLASQLVTPIIEGDL